MSKKAPDSYDERIRILPTGCWQWLGTIVGMHNKTGALPYGIIERGKRKIRAHRYFWEQAKGEEVGKRHLHHKCRNTLCVNPDHLEPLTQAEHNREHGIFRERADRKRAEEFCVHGHPWSENHCIRGGQRICRECERIAQRKRRAERYVPPVRKTHCPAGHPYAGENLVIDGRGARNCRICLREHSLERKRRYRQRLKERAQLNT